jgi:hypothetical protein
MRLSKYENELHVRNDEASKSIICNACQDCQNFLTNVVLGLIKKHVM